MTRLPDRREHLQVIFALLVIFGCAMFVLSPGPTRAQTLFRAGIVLVGTIGLGWASLRGGSG